MTDNVVVEIENGIARIRMDDGKVNALSSSLMGELNEALDAAESAEAVVVLQGRDGMFSAGFDLKTFGRGPDAAREMLRMGAGLVLRLLAFPFPVMSVCAGHAYPMGAFLMLSSDVRIAAEGPWRIGMNEVAISLTIPKFAIELARHRLTPPGLVRVTTAAMVSPGEAMRLGYVDHVVDPAELSDVVSTEAERLRELDFASHAATKARINAPALLAIREGLEEEFPAVD